MEPAGPLYSRRLTMRYLDGGRELKIPGGNIIYDVGAPPSSDGIYYVTSGAVRLTRVFNDGHLLTFDAEAGNIFGLVDTFTGQPRLFKAQALEDCLLYAWDQEAFERAISVYIELAEMAVQILSRRMRLVNDDMKLLT